METAKLNNKSDRTVVVSAYDVEDGRRRDYSIEPGGLSDLMRAVDAVALAQTRDYLTVSKGFVEPGEVLDPAIEGVALGKYAGHETVAASKAPAVIGEGLTVVDDRQAPGVADSGASIARAGAVDVPGGGTAETSTDGASSTPGVVDTGDTSPASGASVQEIADASAAAVVEALKGEALDSALRDRGLSTSGTADEKRARVAEFDAAQAEPNPNAEPTPTS